MTAIAIIIVITTIVVLARIAENNNMNIFTLLLGLLPFGVLAVALFGGK